MADVSQAKGDPIADLYEDIAAEEKARATYQWLIDISDDPYINDSLRFLSERENVHSMRFREAVKMLKYCFRELILKKSYEIIKLFFAQYNDIVQYGIEKDECHGVYFPVLIQEISSLVNANSLMRINW